MKKTWYESGLAFQCTQCGNCCSGPSSGYVWVDDHEIATLAGQMDMADDIDGFERRFIRQVGIRKSLVEYSDGDCIFLDPQSRHCIVYESRPIQCRTWPFWNRNLESRHTWDLAAEGCPGCNRGNVIPLEAIEVARCQKAV
jgi:uncharacterized protein